MSDKILVFKQHYPHLFDVDVDPETGEVQRIRLLITRFNVDQGVAFNAAWDRRMNPPSARSIFRRPDGDEQVTVARGTHEVFAIDDGEIRLRRLREMTDTQRAAFLTQETDEDVEEAAFLEETVRQYVRVAPGPQIQMEPADGGPAFDIHSGADLVRAFGGHRPHMRKLALAVYCENTLGPQEKKLWRSLSASTPSSSGPDPAAVGPTPVATVAPAAIAASAATEDAMDGGDPIRSGLIPTAI